MKKSLMARLGDVLEGVETGKSIQTLERPASDAEPGVLKVSAVSWGVFDPTAAKAVPTTYLPPDSYKVRRGDLLFSRANTIELTGAVAIAERDYPNRYLSDKLLRLVIDEKQALPAYLLFALRSPIARGHIEQHAGGTSDSMRNISQSAMFDIPIPLPELQEQKEIAKRLALAFAEIATAKSALKTQIADMDQLQQRMLSDAFNG